MAGRRGLIVGYSGLDSVAHHLAAHLVKEGAEVAITSRPERCEALREASHQIGVGLHLPLDATSPASIDGAFDELSRAWSSLDFMIHCLVHVPKGVLERPLTDVTLEDFQLVMQTSVFSLVACCRRAKPMLANSTAPRVVTLSSELARLVAPHYHVAGIGKAALESTMRYLAQELGPSGVLCNVLSFSALASAGAERTVGAENISRTRTHIGKRALTERPSDWLDVARSVAWLCSADASNVSGQTIVVDGGFALRYL